MISTNSYDLGYLNLNSLLFSSDPISNEECIRNFIGTDSPEPNATKKSKTHYVEFEEEILCHLRSQLPIKRVSENLRREIKILYSRIALQIEKVSHYREARLFYGDLHKAASKGDISKILETFNSLSSENRHVILGLTNSESLVRFLLTGKNMNRYTQKELVAALMPTFTDLNTKHLGYISENALVRYSITDEVENFLIKSSSLYELNLSLYNKKYIVDQGGKEKAITSSGDRFKGPGVELLRYIANFFHIKDLLDIPTTYIEISNTKSLKCKK